MNRLPVHILTTKVVLHVHLLVWSTPNFDLIFVVINNFILLFWCKKGIFIYDKSD